MQQKMFLKFISWYKYANGKFVKSRKKIDLPRLGGSFQQWTQILRYYAKEKSPNYSYSYIQSRLSYLWYNGTFNQLSVRSSLSVSNVIFRAEETIDQAAYNLYYNGPIIAIIVYTNVQYFKLMLLLVNIKI